METAITVARGFASSAGLIIAIGAQNAFVLAHALRLHHRFAIALCCSLIDAVLIIVGVAGMGLLIADNPQWLRIAAWGGMAFLSVYGARAFWSALRPSTLNPAARGTRSLRATLIAALAVSLLNPHVYLDTVVLLGSIAASQGDSGRWWFALGAASASFGWFFALAYGAFWLAPLFRQPVAWRVLDTVIGVVMWSIAASLLGNT